MAKTYKNLLLQNQKAYGFETLHEASRNRLYKVCINHDPGMTLTYFMARSIWVAHAFEWGKLLKYDLRCKTCSKWGDRQNIYVYEKKMSQGGCLPLPRGHVYDHNIQTSSPLKPLGQSKPNFIWSIVRKGQ